jgi:hypothetical protein
MVFSASRAGDGCRFTLASRQSFEWCDVEQDLSREAFATGLTFQAARNFSCRAITTDAQAIAAMIMGSKDCEMGAFHAPGAGKCA